MTLNRWLGCHRIDLLDCGSTNDEAARLARAGARHGTIVIAESQRAGRGRDGRTWASPPGFGLYLSAIVRPPLPLALVPPMTLAIGVGLCDTLRAHGAHAELKWPNDALVDGKKIAGVLVEAQSQGTRLEAVIIGIGVNLGARSESGPLHPGLGARSESGLLQPGLGGTLPDELADRATTLAAVSNRPVDRERFLATLLEHLEHWLDRYSAGGMPAVAAAWQERMAPRLVARASTTAGTSLVGELAGLDGDGALLLRDHAGELHRVRSGDVEVMRDTQPA
ncbi:MAG: biotin--[acetyl-CoA-carboxylase] ligase [Deltaproteobacteria bacterium]|nr:biotin--[acetyl-CoA-carboxylase] ligase [Deltaproteobacteria bacterium]